MTVEVAVVAHDRPPTADVIAAVRQDSENLINAAVGLAVQGLMTASDVIEMGCMTPDCLTVTTLRRVARVAGVRASSLLS